MNKKDVMRTCVLYNVVKFFNLSCYLVIRNLSAQRDVNIQDNLELYSNNC